MNVTIVKYKVKADRAKENIQYIGAVFAELKEKPPPGLHYASFNLDDGVSSVHVAASSPDIKERCEEPPAATPASLVGAFGMFS